MEPQNAGANSDSDSDVEDLESLLTSPTFPWELSDSDNDYENDWNEGEKMDDNVVAATLIKTMQQSLDLSNSQLGAGLNVFQNGKTTQEFELVDSKMKEWAFIETDSEETITRDVLDITKIKWINIRRYFAKITNSNDPEWERIVQPFYYSWWTIVTLPELFSALHRRLQSMQDLLENAPLKNHVRGGVKKLLHGWISKVPRAFQGDLKLSDRARSFIRGPCSQFVSSSEANTLETLLDVAMQQTTVAPLKLSPNIPKSSTKFLSIDSEELARQLILIEWEIYEKIHPSEFNNLGWLSRGSEAPNISAFISQFNKLSLIVCCSILSQLKLEKRTKMITKWIRVADYCRKLQSPSTVVAIIAGLNRAEVYRLSQARGKVSPSYQKRFQKLTELTEAARNFTNLRRFTNSCKGPTIPYIGVYLTDLTFINDGNPNSLESDSEMINLWKMSLLADTVTEVLKFQSEPFPFQVVPEIRQIFSAAPIGSSDDEQHAVSLYLEPRAGNERPKIAPPLLQVLSNYFDQKFSISTLGSESSATRSSSFSSGGGRKSGSTFGSLKRKKSN